MLIGIDASRATVARRTGTETYSLNLIRALIRLGEGRSFRLYTNDRPPTGLFWPRDQPSNAEVRSIPFPRLWTHLRLSVEMLTRPPDVLFVPAHVLPLIHPRRSVITVHDLGYLYYPEAHRLTDRLYLDWSTRWNAQQATVVLADSEATKTDLVQAYGINPRKVHVVYLGRDETLAPVSDPAALAEVRARYGIVGCYLLYVGTLQPRKNLGRVIEAFARLVGAPPASRPFNGLRAGFGRERGRGGGQLPQDCRRSPSGEGAGGLQLVLAGKRGWLYDDLFAQVKRLGLTGRVIFPGYVADEHLLALLSGAQAFVFPSLYEGFGIPVLEAGACGVPVITSNTSSLPEVAGDAALLVDPHDVDAIAEAMYRLVTDDALRAELARRGLENVKRFSWEKCGRETLAVILEAGSSKLEAGSSKLEARR